MNTPRIDKIDKNYLINGAFDYAQESIGPVTITSTPSYATVDMCEVSAVGTFTVLQSARVLSAPTSKTKYSHEFNFRRNATTGQFLVSQKIESINARDLAGNPISLLINQFFSESPTNVEVQIFTANVEDDFSTVTSIGTFAFSGYSTAINQWNKEVLENITVLPNSAKNGVQIIIKADFSSATDITDQQYRLGEIKLSIGTKAQEFSYSGIDVEDELKKCQMHFSKSYETDVPVGTITDSGAEGGRIPSNILNSSYSLPQTMRQTPIITGWNPLTGLVGSWRNINTSANPAFATQFVGEHNFGVNITVGTANQQFRGHWTADARL